MPPETSPEPVRPVAQGVGQDAWGAFGLVVSGVAVWGGVGAVLSAWIDSRIPVMIGLLVGMTAGLYLVWFRYGRA